MEIVLILRGMPAADGIGFVMDVLGWVVWMQHQSVNVREAEMKYTSFLVIDPDYGVKVTADVLLLGTSWAASDIVAGQSDSSLRGR